MMKCVYAEKLNGKYRLFNFTGEQISDSGKGFDALMMSRLDFDIKILKIPPAHDEDMHNLLKYKIRGLYPGTPEDTVFDYRIVTQKKASYAILFITTKSVLDEYKKTANKRPMFLPYTLVHPLINNYIEKNCVITFWHSSWAEILFFNRGLLRSSVVFKTEKDNMTENVHKFKSFIPEERADHIHLVFICSEQNINIFTPQFKGLFPNKSTYEFLSLPERLNLVTRKADFLFTGRKKNKFLPQRLRLGLLILALLVLSGLTLLKFVTFKEKYNNILKGHLITLEEKYSQSVSIKNETESLKKTLISLEDKIPLDMYQVLSRLSQVLDSDVNIVYFSIDKGRFQLEGVGPNTLVLMQKFSAHPDFSDTRLLQIVPVEGSNKEKFRITGIAQIK